MQLRYRFRIYPTLGQRVALAKAFGCARVVYNDCVAARRNAFQAGQNTPTSAALSRKLITEAKKTPDRAWLDEVSAVVLQQALRDAQAAYHHFFATGGGKRTGPRIGSPRFKSRKDRRQTARFTPNARWQITPGGKLRLPKVGEIPVRWSRELPSAASTVTVIKRADGRYYASFVVDSDPEGHGEYLPVALDVDGAEVELALDLGLHAFATDQHGRVITNPKVLRRAEKKLKKAQHELSRKQIASRNREKARRKVARRHARVADVRMDWLHQESTRIVRENQVIYLEDLSVKGLARGRLAKSVRDASWGRFIALLDYKARRYGRTLVKIDRWHPSSKRCSQCGVVKPELSLSTRVFVCEACGLVLDRDVNAARNILAAGRKLTTTVVGGGEPRKRDNETPGEGRVRPLKTVAQAVEAGTRRKATAGHRGQAGGPPFSRRAGRHSVVS